MFKTPITALTPMATLIFLLTLSTPTWSQDLHFSPIKLPAKSCLKKNPRPATLAKKVQFAEDDQLTTKCEVHSNTQYDRRTNYESTKPTPKQVSASNAMIKFNLFSIHDFDLLLKSDPFLSIDKDLSVAIRIEILTQNPDFLKSCHTKRPLPSTPIQAMVPIIQLTEDEIRLQAYLLAEKDHFRQHPDHYWFMANKLLRAHSQM